MNFKEELAVRLLKVVRSLHPDVNQIAYEESEEGFFCDYDIPPLNPDSFRRISDSMLAGEDVAFELTGFSGVYEDGDSRKRTLQRIYVAAFKTMGELENYKAFVAEASKCDHKALGAELKLFSSSAEIGQGLNLWHPKGAMLRYLLESFGQKAHILNGYEWVYTPHIGRAELWKTSGHLDFYSDSMYNPIVIDNEEYYLKPMNCPFHINIYNSEVHSYKELPIKYAEYGTVYRYELSGTLNGLTRVRGFTQDDAHIICTPEQIEKEVTEALRFSLYILRSFGLEQFEPYVSTRPKSKYVGNDSDWEMATDILKKAVTAVGLEYKIDEGGGAFYGPKIDLKLRDSLNRQWQCSTIQFDFNLPVRFEMFYMGNDGLKHTPYMIHRALFGSLERFIALLIEHYKGDFPLWFTPVQFGIVPIKEDHNDYAKKLSKEFKAIGFRVSLNSENEHMRNKIKRYELEKIPYILVIGDREVADVTFSVRSRKDGNLGSMNLTSFYEYLKPQLELGTARSID